jgi:hypothetical protein
LAFLAVDFLTLFFTAVAFWAGDFLAGDFLTLRFTTTLAGDLTICFTAVALSAGDFLTLFCAVAFVAGDFLAWENDTGKVRREEEQESHESKRKEDKWKEAMPLSTIRQSWTIHPRQQGT